VITKDNVGLHSIAEFGVHGCSAVSLSKNRVKGGKVARHLDGPK
jgi:hypothetical protein